MNWDGLFDRCSKAVDVVLKAEMHAFLLIGFGAYISLHGPKDVGMPLITAGCLAFKGNRA